MGVSGAVQALPWVIGILAIGWLVIALRRGAKDRQRVKDLEAESEVKNEQLKAANKRPRGKSDVTGRLRDKGGL